MKKLISPIIDYLKTEKPDFGLSGFSLRGRKRFAGFALFVLLWAGFGFMWFDTNIRAGNGVFTGSITASGSLSAGSLTSGKVSRDCRLDGMAADGVTDDSAVFNSCIANAVSNTQSIVQLPCGDILVNTAINLTNRSGMTVQGCSAIMNSADDGIQTATNRTRIKCNTGGVCMDTTGSSHLTLAYFTLTNFGQSTASTTGILQGRDNNGGGGGSNPFCFSENAWFHDIHVAMAHSTTMNANNGGVGIANIAAELTTYQNVIVTADIPWYINGNNANPITFTSPYQTLATGCSSSMTNVQFTGASAARYSGTTGNGAAGVWANSTGNIAFQRSVLFICVSCTTAAITLLGTNTAWDIYAQFENANGTSNGTINIAGNIEQFNVFSTTASQANAVAYIVPANSPTITNSTFKISYLNGTAAPLFNNSTATIRGGYIDFGTTQCSGMNLPNITLANVQVRADGCTNANQAFAAGSVYDLYNNSGITRFGGQFIAESTSITALSGYDGCYADSTLHGRVCNDNSSTFNPMGSRAVLTADWTCGTGGTVSSCVAPQIIGSGGGVPWTFNLPLVANSLQLDCDGVVGQATAATSNQWNLLTSSNGAANVTATYDMYTAATAKAGGAVTDQASTTSTFQIAPNWTLGGTATKMPFHIHAAIEGASASGTILSVQLLAPTVGDLVTIYRGSGCWVHP